MDPKVDQQMSEIDILRQTKVEVKQEPAVVQPVTSVLPKRGLASLTDPSIPEKSQLSDSKPAVASKQPDAPILVLQCMMDEDEKKDEQKKKKKKRNKLEQLQRQQKKNKEIKDAAEV